VPSLARTKFPISKAGFKRVGLDYITIRKPIGPQNHPHATSAHAGAAKIFYFRAELRNLG
jgi:hypothetical protein